MHSALASFYKQNNFNDASYLSDSAGPKGEGKTTTPPALPTDGSGEGWSGEVLANATRQLNDLRKAASDGQAKLAITALQAFAFYATGQDENAVELLHEAHYLEKADVAGIKAGNASHEGSEYTAALLMMGFTVYGLANERLMTKRGDEGYVPFALAGYASTIDIHEGLRGGKAAKALRGLPADEIERWAELALYHNALFSVRYGNPAVALNALRAYQANAGRWPSNYRVSQRLVVYRTYLATLNKTVEENTYTLPPSGVSASRDDCRSIAYQSSVLAASASRVEIRDFESERLSRSGTVHKATSNSAGANGVSAARPSARTVSKRRPAPHRSIRPPTSYWSNETLTVQRSAADAMARTSQFPQAGKVNKAALELADELIKGWRYSGERGGFDADELIDILYILARFTFHSQRIMRHLFTVLVAAENYDEARKALELYIQIVEKAREGDAADAAALVEETRRREGDPEPTDEEREEDGEKFKAKLTQDAKKAAQEVHVDADSDAIYLHTLLHGAHVFCRYLNDAHGAKKLTEKVEKATDSKAAAQLLTNDHFLLAKIKRVAGSTLAAYCRAVNISSERVAMQTQALSLLKQAVTYDDQSSETFFQLAQLQSEMLEVNVAIRSARRAVELEPANVEYWHLLTLLVSAQQNARGALRVAEEGLAEAEDDDQDGHASEPNGLPNGINGAAGQTNVSSDAKPNVRTSLLSMDFPPSRRERMESIVQLMITHNALEEVVEGSQAAIEGQREIFEFFHTRLATWEHAPRTVAPGTAMNGKTAVDGKGTLNGSLQRDASFSTTISDAGHPHTRFHSLTGMGQSGSSHHLLSGALKGLSLHHHHAHHGVDENGNPNSDASGGGLSTATPQPPQARGDDEDAETSAPTYAQLRDKRRQAEEVSLFASVWLMSAASLRRNGSLAECRVAVQEAERIDPAMAEVWLQLALWFEQQPALRVDEPPVGLAIQCLYKALACQSEHIGATVHLARLFVTHPLNPHIRKSAPQPSLKGVPDPLPDTSDNFQVSPLARELLSQTQSRKISASHGPASSGPIASKEQKERNISSQTDAAYTSEKRKRLSTLSMAEGLLVSLTQNGGWATPEAWLYLSKVLQQTNRPERQRECLQYALQLERAKPIRSVSQAIRYAC